MTGAVAVVALNAAFVAAATGARLERATPDLVFTQVSIDTRTLAPGALYVALAGERLDGHDFIADARAKGAACVMAARLADGAADGPLLLVPDTLHGLQQLGRAVRRASGAAVVAITGSAGKTTTKELAADMLARRYRVFRNSGNLNNHIGLPLSLTALTDGPDVAVVELGMNHAGEIRLLVSLAEPEMRVWTNVGDAHLGFFGTREAVAGAKAEILEGAAPDHVFVANADDALVMAHARRFAGRVVTFGSAADADVRAGRIDDRGLEGVVADVESRWGSFQLTLALPGRVHLANALAAAAVALDRGVTTADVASVAAAARPLARRGRMTRLASGARLVDDTYNASPAAVVAMLDALAVTPGAERRLAVLGEMLELGDAARALHQACGEAAVRAGVDRLVAIGGPAADGLVEGARAAGLAADRIDRYATAAEAAPAVARLVRAGDLVLAKGSRGTRVDLVADALTGSGGAA